MARHGIQPFFSLSLAISRPPANLFHPCFPSAPVPFLLNPSPICHFPEVIIGTRKDIHLFPHAAFHHGRR